MIMNIIIITECTWVHVRVQLALRLTIVELHVDTPMCTKAYIIATESIQDQ